MACIADVNVLIYAHRGEMELHRRTYDWLISADSPVLVPDVCAASFIRLVTNERLFAPTTPVSEALAFVDQLRLRADGRLPIPSPGHWELFRALSMQLDLRGNDIPDAYLAALAIDLNLDLVTYDHGFARFPGLRWRQPD